MQSGRSPSWTFTQEDQIIKEHDMTKYPDLAEHWATSLDEILNIYLGTMDQTMNCSVNRMKYQLNRDLIDAKVLWGIKLSDPVVTSLEQLNEAILAKIQQDDCIEPSDDGDVTQQTKMTNSLMYEQCVYQYYLTYYAHNVQGNIAHTFTQKDPQGLTQLLSTVLWTNAYAASDAKTVIEHKEAVRALLWRVQSDIAISRRTLGDAIDIHSNIPQAYVPYTLLKIIEMQAVEAKRYLHVYLRAIIILAEKVQNAMKKA